MRHIQRQNIDLAGLYLQCVTQKKDAAMRQRFQVAQPAVIESAIEYAQLGQTMNVYQFIQPMVPVGGATRDDMVKLYETTLARKGGAGRWAYDAILGGAPLGICPFCGQNPVSTLDHYLPKESRWALAITPDNLIPACRDCNYWKGYACPQEENTQPFHPYFDPVGNNQWLFASVERTAGLWVRFYVEDAVEGHGRAQHHFELFKLGALYKTYAADELVNIRHQLVNLYAAGGTAAVRSHLLGQAESRREAHLNSWQTALYQALASDDRFCSGDFNLIEV